VPAEPSGELELADVLAQLPYLTVHLVDLPGRWWVADPATLTCWVHKHSTREQRENWVTDAGAAIVAHQRDQALVPATGRSAPRLHSVPR
jgi:hypothetical protein